MVAVPPAPVATVLNTFVQQTTLHELVAFPNLDDWFTNMWPQGLTIGPYTLNGYRHIGLMGDAWNPAFLNPYDVVRLDFDVIQVHDFNDGLEDLPDLVVAVGNGLRTHFFCPWCGIDQPAQKWDEVIRPPWSDNTNLARSTILHLKKMEHRVIRKLLTVIIVQLARAQQANVGGIDQQQQQDQALLAAFPGNLDAVVEQQQEAADFNVDDFENLLAGGGLPPLNPDLFDAADQQQFLNWGQ
ncbi:hypothetical protein DFJ74DRAFT_655323 [Hyaloraphidium curvatum]|nr:hypothetical protein DFJ74DRAFT_655323 [Hyaloraphidium curvatum]